MQVFLDGKEYLNKKIQTNHSLGLAFFADNFGHGVPGSIAETVKKGKHTLKVIVNDSISHKKTFTVKDDLYIGVSYDRQAQAISFFYSPFPFVYD